MIIVVVILVLLLISLDNSSGNVNYGCFDILCNHGQLGYYYMNTTNIYIPSSITDSLITIGNNTSINSNSNSIIYNNITICLSLSLYNDDHDNDNNNDSYCIYNDNIQYNYDNDSIVISKHLIGLYQCYWSISTTHYDTIDDITYNYYNTYTYNNTILIIELQVPLILG